MKRAILALLALSPLLQAGGSGSRVLYVGGTVAGVHNKIGCSSGALSGRDTHHQFRDNSIRSRTKDINTLEYGMRVSRRYLEAVLISPVFLVAKRRTHFLTIGYSDSNGNSRRSYSRSAKTRFVRCLSRWKPGRGAGRISGRRSTESGQGMKTVALALFLSTGALAVEPRNAEATLAQVKRVYVDQLGGGDTSDQMRDM